VGLAAPRLSQNTDLTGGLLLSDHGFASPGLRKVAALRWPGIEGVNKALEASVRKQTFAKVDLHAGTDIWEGEIAEMGTAVPR
jgi:hypothetical protein